MSSARVAVLQFPGVNCEAETVRALARAGLEGEVFRWTRPARELAAFDAFVLPGGFSYQDRVRAGALAAKDPLVDALAEQADAGRPVLGICNGAQVLVEAGLVPGGAGDGVAIALARNRMPDRTGYQARWSWCRVEESACVFTRRLARGALLPMPVAHAEGRFTAADPGAMAELAAGGQVPLRYVDVHGALATGFPENPNGSEVAAAAVGNARGNVLAMMPHPERVLDLGAIARTVGGGWGARRDGALELGGEAPYAPSPGMGLFTGLRAHLEDA